MGQGWCDETETCSQNYVLLTIYIYIGFDVLLTVHLSIILVINRLNVQNLVL